MLIEEIMHQNPTVISPDSTLREAYKLMKEKTIRHLPVLDGNKIVGIVTDRDLRLATSSLSDSPLSPDEKISKIMIKQVYTANASDPVSSAIKIMRMHKIGCLPILEEEKLVGILTGIDVLDSMIIMTGMKRPGGKLELRLNDSPGELARMTSIIAEKNINIHSILTYIDKEEKGRLVLRLGTIDIRPIAKSLCSQGFEILWPPNMICEK